MINDNVEFKRPKTRGELAECLKNNEQCEVVAYVAEMTSSMLRGWLGVSDITITKSPNPGWVIMTLTNKNI